MARKGKLQKGLFSPKNPKKYKGDPTRIIHRSGWELRVMHYLDNNPAVLEWQSEEFFIPYISPLDNRPHRYFPDFWVRTAQGIQVLEIKPYKETIEPKTKKKKTRQYITEVTTWAKNKSKWEAAQEYCRVRGWEFKIITEHHIFGDGKRSNK